MLRACIYIFFLVGTMQYAWSQKNLLPVKLNGKWGYIDETAKMIITPQYEFAEEFKDNSFAVITKEGKAGLINKQGKLVVNHEYDDLKLLTPGYFLIQKDSLQGIVDTNGKIIYNCLADDIFNLKNNHFLIQQEDKYGLVNGRGKVIIPIQYDSIIYINNNLFQIVVSGKQGLSDSTHKILLKSSYTKIRFPYSTNKAVVFFSSGKKWGFTTLNGKCFCDTIWANYKQFGSNFIYCSNQQKSCLYSLSTNTNRTDSINNNILVFSRNYLKISLHNKFGLLDSLCRIIISPVYDDVNPISDTIFSVLRNGKWAIANAQGKIKTDFVYDEIFPYNSFFCLVNSGNYCGIIDKTLTETAKPIYTKIDQMEKIFKLYDKKGGLKILYYNKQGDITENENYQNVATIKIGQQTSSKILFSTSNVNPLSKMYNKFGWYQDSITKKWGLKDSLNKWVLVPQFSSVFVFDSLNLTKVEVEVARTYFRLGNGDVEYSTLYGIVNHKTKKIIVPAKYVGIEMKNFTPGTNNVAHFVKTNGNWGLVTQNGKIILDDILYIGPFSCGRARVFEKGQIIASEDANVYNEAHEMDDAYDYAQNIPGKAYYNRYNRDEAYISCVRGMWSYVNSCGEKVSFDSLTYFSYAQNFVNNTAIVEQENKFGLLSTTKIVLPFEYANIYYLPNTHNELLSLEKLNMRYGYIKKNGVVLSAFKYQSAKDFNNHFAAIVKDGKWGFIDTSGKEIVACKYNKVKDFTEGIAAVSRKGKWGFIDESGEEIIDCKYKAVGNFSEGVCPVVENNKWGFIDASGRIVIKCEYNFCESFYQGYAVVTNKQGKGLMDKSGKLIIECKYRALSNIDKYGYLIAEKDHLFGIINIRKNKIVPFHYRSISSFKDGFAIVNTKKGYGYIDSTGSISIKPKYMQARPFSEGLAAVKEYGTWVFIDKEGTVISKEKFTQVKDFSNGYAAVRMGKNSTFINKTGTRTMPYMYGISNSFSTNGLALVKRYRKAYFVNKKGENPVKYRFDNAQDFLEDLAFVCKNGKWGLINKHGLFSVTYKYEWAKGFKEGISVVRKNKLYGVCNNEGKLVVEPVYDYVGYSGNETFRIENNEKIGYLKSNGKWIWSPSE